MSYNQKYWLQQILAYLVSIGIPIATTLIVFPESIQQGTTTSLSMSFVLTIIVSLTAFRKKLATLFENSPVLITWLIVLAFSVALKTFADQMFIIAISGVASSAGATPLFNMAEKNRQKAQLLKEELLKKEINNKVEDKK